MVASYSLNLRWRVVYLLLQGFTVEHVARLLHVGNAFVKRIRNIYQNTETVHYQSRPGRVRKLEGKLLSTIWNEVFVITSVNEPNCIRRRNNHCFSHLDLAQDILFIRNVVPQYPEIYENEIQEWIQLALGKTIQVSTIAKLLKKMGFTRRKVHITRVIFEKEQEKQFINLLKHGRLRST